MYIAVDAHISGTSYCELTHIMISQSCRPIRLLPDLCGCCSATSKLHNHVRRYRQWLWVQATFEEECLCNYVVRIINIIDMAIRLPCI